jgi:hypothetical protein
MILMAEQGYTQQTIRNSGINQGCTECMHPIYHVYGVATPIRGEDHRVKICDNEMSMDELRQKLQGLEERTNQSYDVGIISSGYCSEEDFDGIAVIGRNVKGKDYHQDQGSLKLIKRGTLIKMLKESDEIIRDLESIGFRGITSRDLILHAEYYND